MKNDKDFPRTIRRGLVTHPTTGEKYFDFLPEEEQEGVLTFHESDYFNANTLYLFEGTTKCFVSKVHKHKSYWYTDKSLQYKTTSIRSVSIESLKTNETSKFKKILKDMIKHFQESAGGCDGLSDARNGGRLEVLNELLNNC